MHLDTVEPRSASSGSGLRRPVRDLARRVFYFGLRKQAAWRRRKFIRLIEQEYEKAIVFALQCINSTTDGDIAEFGCRGVTAAIECEYLQAFGRDRTLHLFDAFQMPLEATEADSVTPEIIRKRWNLRGGPKGMNPVRAEDLKRKLGRIYRPDRISIYEGLFRDTLSTIAPQTKFALVVVDCTLFSSTHQVLTHLFEHKMITEGCVFLLSDWNMSRASPDHSTRKAWGLASERFGIEYSDEGRYSWGGARFIVHSYR